MPTILIDGPYRLFFYSSDRDEPLHVHVEHNGKTAKFWLEPLRLDKSGGFSRAELRDIKKVILRHSQKIREVWNEYFEC